MGLEENINYAYWIDLGTTDYRYAFDLQVKYANLRKDDKIPDIIFCTQHNPVISFGTSKMHNGFSEKFLQDVQEKYGNTKLDTIVNYLKQKGIQFYDASINSHDTIRGGGSTYIGPGQLLIYPVVNYKKILGPIESLGIAEYNNKICTVMLDVLREFYNIDAQAFKVTDILPDNPLNEERKDRKDIWIEKNGKFYKLGSKGVRIQGNIAYHGFSLFVKKEGIIGFDKILVCGYTKNQLDVTSMEHEYGDEIDIEEVKRGIKEKILLHFNYEDIINITILDML